MADDIHPHTGEWIDTSSHEKERATALKKLERRLKTGEPRYIAAGQGYEAQNISDRVRGR